MPLVIPRRGATFRRSASASDRQRTRRSVASSAEPSADDRPDPRSPKRSQITTPRVDAGRFFLTCLP